MGVLDDVSNGSARVDDVRNGGSRVDNVRDGSTGIDSVNYLTSCVGTLSAERLRQRL